MKKNLSDRALDLEIARDLGYRIVDEKTHHHGSALTASAEVGAVCSKCVASYSGSWEGTRLMVEGAISRDYLDFVRELVGIIHKAFLSGGELPSPLAIAMAFREWRKRREDGQIQRDGNDLA